MCVAKPENIAGRNPLPLWANIARDRWEWGLWFRADYAWELICFLLDSPEHQCTGVRGLISRQEKTAALAMMIYRETFPVCGSVSAFPAGDSVAFCEKKFP